MVTGQGQPATTAGWKLHGGIKVREGQFETIPLQPAPTSSRPAQNDLGQLGTLAR